MAVPAASEDALEPGHLPDAASAGGAEESEIQQGLRDFHALKPSCLEALRYRAEDVGRSLTKTVIQEVSRSQAPPGGGGGGGSHKQIRTTATSRLDRDKLCKSEDTSEKKGGGGGGHTSKSQPLLLQGLIATSCASQSTRPR